MYSVSPSPHIRHKDSTFSIMFDVIVALSPAVAWGAYIFGLRALVIILLSIGTAALSEFLFSKVTKRKNTCGDLSCVVTGLLVALNLPVAVPLWLPVLGSAFAIIVAKMLFGGLGKNIVNPALAARAFLFISFPTAMRSFTLPFDFYSASAVSVDAVTTATPLVTIKQSGVVNLNMMKDLFFGGTAGCIGEVSALLILLGGVYLIIRKVITPHITISFVLTVFLLSFFFARGDAEPINCAIYETLSGGLILSAVFMATDYTTSPVTYGGKVIYGIGCGVVTVFLRYFGSYPEGVSFAILIMNTFVYYLDRLTKPKTFGKGQKART